MTAPPGAHADEAADPTMESISCGMYVAARDSHNPGEYNLYALAFGAGVMFASNRSPIGLDGKTVPANQFLNALYDACRTSPNELFSTAIARLVQAYFASGPSPR
jgi:hypothetical protein